MTVMDTFSKRLRRESGQIDPYTYDFFPQGLKVQIIHLWEAHIGDRPIPGQKLSLDDQPLTYWDVIERAIAPEQQVFKLGNSEYSAYARCKRHLWDAEFPHAMDLVEFTFRFLENRHRGTQDGGPNANSQTTHPAIAELNTRLQENAVGYRFMEGKLVRIDSDYVHSEALVPAIRLLINEEFAGAEAEFMSAHAHYRAGRHEEAIADANKAFESTMKVICSARGWITVEEEGKVTANDLISRLFQNGLIPEWLQKDNTALKSTLVLGLPRVRNKAAGHGAGATPREVPQYFAGYALHLAASNIVFLVEAHKAMPLSARSDNEDSDV